MFLDKQKGEDIDTSSAFLIPRPHGLAVWTRNIFASSISLSIRNKEYCVFNSETTLKHSDKMLKSKNFKNIFGIFIFNNIHLRRNEENEHHPNNCRHRDY